MSDDPHRLSLQEVHGKIEPAGKSGKWKKIFAFFGPAYLVSVGYMDPGNWATDLAAGSRYGYTLIWVLLMSNVMALLLQSLAARLGVVQGKDLAQCNRQLYPAPVNFTLYILAEIAIAACDLAEVIGMAIGLQLLLGIPLLWGVLITLLDTILLLYLQKLGMRKMEAFIITLIFVIGVCFLTEMFFAHPSIGGIVSGFVPRIPDQQALYIAIGVIGATVMPHNLYLHSALVQTRKVGRDQASLKQAILLNTVDSAIALNLAFFVNAAIMILAAAVFFRSGRHEIAGLQQAHELLSPLLGSRWASHLFAIALIAAGQSSTVTGTLAGQIVMEGYLRLRINPWLRRLLTRLLAIVPAVLVILIMGEKEVDAMLIFSQVLLSMQLAFAIIPLIHFVSDKHRMEGFAINRVTKTFAWIVALVIIALNGQVVGQQAISWIRATGSTTVHALIWLFLIGLVALLAITTVYPWLRTLREQEEIDIHPDSFRLDLAHISERSFHRIVLALDYSYRDEKVMEYAIRLAAPDSVFILIHVVESAPAKMFGQDVKDYETIRDQERLDAYVALLTNRGFRAEGILGFKQRAGEIARISRESEADLIVVGSHGHKAIKDWIFGETINELRHMVKAPVFIAQ